MIPLSLLKKWSERYLWFFMVAFMVSFLLSIVYMALDDPCWIWNMGLGLGFLLGPGYHAGKLTVMEEGSP